MAVNKEPQKARAELEIYLERGWPLPSTNRSDNEYWSWVKFDSDKNLKRGIWTLFIKLDETPAGNKSKYISTVYFLAPDAPEEFLFVGSQFELFSGHGETVKAKGKIIEIKP